MIKVLIIFSFLWIIIGSGAHTQAVQTTSVASSGETSIVASSVKSHVWVEIITHETDIGKPNEKRPDRIRSNCTYSRYPCSVVDDIYITVNSKPIIVLRSVFSDLADLNIAEVKVEEDEASLMLSGGDASENYIVKIDLGVALLGRP